MLEEYGIACVTCNVGTCRLKDIIDIHNLTPEEEHGVMLAMAKVIYPDREVEIPRTERKPATEAQTYSPPIQKLVNEHILIKKLVSFIPSVIEELGKNRASGKHLVEGAVDFISSYADRFHHAKEEEILFTYFDENAEIFQVMRQDHEQARNHVKGIRKALQDRDSEAVQQTVQRHLEAYSELLNEHIKKEDEVLYPWIDRNLTTSQVGELFSRFSQVDREFGDEPRRHEAFIEKLETSIHHPTAPK